MRFNIDLLTIERPILSNSRDSDNDGVADQIDGLGDNDYDYLPNYLDKHEQPHILSMALKWPNSYLIEAETGLTLRLTEEALLLNHYGAYMNAEHYEDLVNYHNYPIQNFGANDALGSVHYWFRIHW